MIERKYSAENGAGVAISPISGVVPVLKEVDHRKLSVVGTAFYATRYGTIVTAGHVIEALVDASCNKMVPSYILHAPNNEEFHIRRILTAHLSKKYDLAIAQTETFSEKFPRNPLMNLKCRFSCSDPRDGASLVIYTYPENAILDFNIYNHTPEIKANYYGGKMLRIAHLHDHPFLPFKHYETSIDAKSGASGGPVFDNTGSVVGIISRSWDFGEIDSSTNHLSYIIPTQHILDLEIGTEHVPKNSWELGVLNKHTTSKMVKVRTMARLGIILIDAHSIRST